jgi:hypothetical protein
LRQAYGGLVKLHQGTIPIVLAFRAEVRFFFHRAAETAETLT